MDRLLLELRAMNEAERTTKAHGLFRRVQEHHWNPWFVQGGKDHCCGKPLAEKSEDRFHYDVRIINLLLMWDPDEDLGMRLNPDCLCCTQSKDLLSVSGSWLPPGELDREEGRERDPLDWAASSGCEVALISCSLPLCGSARVRNCPLK